MIYTNGRRRLLSETAFVIKCRPVSRVLCPRKNESSTASVISLGSRSREDLKQPTHHDNPGFPEKAAGSCTIVTYLVFQHPGFTPATVASRSVRSYRTFSPLLSRLHGISGIVLCGTFHSFPFPENLFPLGSELPCVARTFLCILLHSDGIVCGAKIRNP